MSKAESGGTLGTLSFEIDTSAIENATAKLKESMEALELSRQYREGQLGSGVASVEAIQGCVTGNALDPLEQAIESTVRMVRDEHQQMVETGAKQDTALCDRLGAHLDRLLAIQLERVTVDE